MVKIPANLVGGKGKELFRLGLGLGRIMHFKFKNSDGRMVFRDRVAMNLKNGELTFETDVVRSLGVGEKTYTVLAILGAILASGLGSGWLIKLLVTLKYRSRR